MHDPDKVTTEGCLVAGYPLVVIGSLRGDAEMMRRGLRQLQLRREILTEGDRIYQRKDGGRLVYPNWARGYAWYLLGFVRSHPLLEAAGLADDALVADLKTRAEFAIRHQLPDGLWNCFIDDPSTGVDTSGSLGIAAALTLGFRHGLLDESAREAAARTLRGITAWVSPDGLISGAAQLNKGGEGLQRSDYRVVSQYSLGLLAQLWAALEKAAKPLTAKNF